MASTSRGDSGEKGVEFIHEDDGSITARDKETGVASFGDTKSEALRMLAEALELHEGGGIRSTMTTSVRWALIPTIRTTGSFRTS